MPEECWMTIDDLAPHEREEVQRHYVRVWHARRRRAQYGRVQTGAPSIAYDVADRLATAGDPFALRLTTMGEDSPSQ
jgi:hypothetical protein